MKFCFFPIGVLTSSYLNSDLWEVHLHGQLLSAVHVWVVGLLEGALQLVKLVRGEGGAVASVFLLGLIVPGRLWRSALVTVQTPGRFAQFIFTLTGV